MCSSSREEIVEVLDALEAGYKRALDLTFDVLTTPERLRVLERFEVFRRQQPAIEHALINQLAEQSDVIRLGSHAHHYLAIFDNGKALALYHTKRLASPAQRIVLYAKDRGCTFPGCTVPAYQCQAHHNDPYRTHPVTDINTLTLTCHPNHDLTEQGYTTRKNAHGQTEWIPPPHLDHGQPRVNTYHHPEKLLRDDDEDDGAH